MDIPLIKTGHFFDTTPNNYKDWVVGPFVKEEEFCTKNFELKFQKGEQGTIRKPKKVLNGGIIFIRLAKKNCK